MRWLALAVLSACSFSPGPFMQSGGDDVQGGSDSGTPDDAPDAPTDAAADAALILPDTVRMIDIVDAQITGGPHADFPLLVSLSSQTWLRSMAKAGTSRFPPLPSACVTSRASASRRWSSPRCGRSRLP